MKVIKKKGQEENWDNGKILKAITKSCKRAGVVLTQEEESEVLSEVLNKAYSGISVADLHTTVESVLTTVSEPAGKAYKDYRNYKQNFVRIWDEVYNKTKDVMYRGDRENANFLSTLVSTKGSLIRGYVTKELYQRFNLTPEELDATNEGYIYIHDIKDMIFGSVNCCLFDMANVLKDGFEMSNLKYAEPNSALSGLQVIGDVILSASAQMFGGFTVPQIDEVILPYCKKTLVQAEEDAKFWGIVNIEKYKMLTLEKELSQGFQALEMKLNSIPSSRGDFSFTTFSFGALVKNNKLDRSLQKLVCETMLKVRMKGQGKGEPVVFPKYVFLFSQEQHNNYEDYQSLVDLGIECSSKAMYPDWLSIDVKGDVSRIYKESGKIVSPMGKE